MKTMFLDVLTNAYSVKHSRDVGSRGWREIGDNLVELGLMKNRFDEARGISMTETTKHGDALIEVLCAAAEKYLANEFAMKKAMRDFEAGLPEKTQAALRAERSREKPE